MGEDEEVTHGLRSDFVIRLSGKNAAMQCRSFLMQDLEHAIRERAYHLWIADGCRDGAADEHWLTAQRQILADSLGHFARVTVGSGVQATAETKPTSKVKKAKTKGKRHAA
jgi:hypothetical protein